MDGGATWRTAAPRHPATTLWHYLPDQQGLPGRRRRRHHPGQRGRRRHLAQPLLRHRQRPVWDHLPDQQGLSGRGRKGHYPGQRGRRRHLAPAAPPAPANTCGASPARPAGPAWPWATTAPSWPARTAAPADYSRGGFGSPGSPLAAQAELPLFFARLAAIVCMPPRSRELSQPASEWAPESRPLPSAPWRYCSWSRWWGSPSGCRLTRSLRRSWRCYECSCSPAPRSRRSRTSTGSHAWSISRCGMSLSLSLLVGPSKQGVSQGK